MSLATKLEQFGLSGKEAEVYLALLQKKEFTAPDIAKITTITRTKTYEYLEKLVQKGLCNVNLRNGQKLFSAVNPRIVFKGIIGNYEKELEEKKKEAASLEIELASIHTGNLDNHDPVSYIEVLTDISQIRAKWLDIQNSAKKEILAFTKPPYTRKVEDNLEEEAALLNKNLEIKSIYEYEGLNGKELEELIAGIKAFRDVGEQSRVIKELPMKLLICDEMITMLALNDRVSLKPSITTIIVDHPSYARAQKEVFNAYWEKAMTVEELILNKLTINN